MPQKGIYNKSWLSDWLGMDTRSFFDKERPNNYPFIGQSSEKLGFSSDHQGNLFMAMWP